MNPNNRDYQIDQRLVRLERELAELNAERQERIESPISYSKPEKWEPEGGNWYVRASGVVDREISVNPGRCFGVERPTRELAEKARDAMRVHNRALAYVHEHAPDWDGSDPHYVSRSLHGSCEYMAVRLFGAHTAPIGMVTGPEHVMRVLAGDLNSGRVEL